MYFRLIYVDYQLRYYSYTHHYFLFHRSIIDQVRYFLQLVDLVKFSVFVGPSVQVKNGLHMNNILTILA